MTRAGLICLALLILATGASGCAGTRVSGRPIYPDRWPVLDTGRGCPDLSGKYRALSDEAAPLVYPPGDHPRQSVFLIAYGNPEPVPPLGRRILPWHLAGAFSSDQAMWSSLSRYAAAVEADATDPALDGEAGWVEVAALTDGAIEVRAGLHDRTLLNLALSKEAQGLWTIKSHVYDCSEGGLVIVGSFPPPPEENPTGQTNPIGAKFTFFRATDGSIVALEEAYTGVNQGNLVFNKWWRWRRIE